jgi:hypothetical protein
MFDFVASRFSYIRPQVIGDGSTSTVILYAMGIGIPALLKFVTITPVRAPLEIHPGFRKMHNPATLHVSLA